MKEFLSEKKEKLLDERDGLKAYLLSKYHGDVDWHAIQDAASDIRDIDAKLEFIDEVEKQLNGCNR